MAQMCFVDIWLDMPPMAPGCTIGGPIVDVGDCSGVSEVPGEARVDPAEEGREPPGDMEDGEWRVGDCRAPPGGDKCDCPGDICEDGPMLKSDPEELPPKDPGGW